METQHCTGASGQSWHQAQGTSRWLPRAWPKSPSEPFQAVLCDKSWGFWSFHRESRGVCARVCVRSSPGASGLFTESWCVCGLFTESWCVCARACVCVRALLSSPGLEEMSATILQHEHHKLWPQIHQRKPRAQIWVELASSLFQGFTVVSKHDPWFQKQGQTLRGSWARPKVLTGNQKSLLESEGRGCYFRKVSPGALEWRHTEIWRQMQDSNLKKLTPGSGKWRNQPESAEWQCWWKREWGLSWRPGHGRRGKFLMEAGKERTATNADGSDR